MKKAGLSELIITEIIRIYSFDVDFQRDIYEGDYFEALFTRRKMNKEKQFKLKILNTSCLVQEELL